jgi:phosphohistidine swiveling domain-containing protein
MPSTLKNQAELIFAQEEYTDPLIRFAIVTGQVGQIARHLYRDNEVKARLVGKERAEKEVVREPGTKADEELKICEAIIQLALYAESRGLNIDNSMSTAFNKIYEKDWKENQQDGLAVSASLGDVWGEVVFIRSEFDIASKLESRRAGPVIAVMKSTEPDLAHRAILNEWVVGIICSVGGKTSHPAIVAREKGIPCAMNYNPWLKEGEKICLIVRDKEVGIQRKV